ncbi:MAG: GNAT family N-acetyltransferase [Ferruginibacter sp.]
MKIHTPANVLQPVHLENELVRIIPLTATDFERLYAIASDPLIWEQHPASNRYKEEVFRIYFDSAVAAGTAFLIFEKSSGTLIGCTRYYDHNTERSSIAIGYTFLARQYWGGLYNQSVKKLLIDNAFQFADAVIFHIGACNIRSQKAIEKTGAHKTGEFFSESNGKQLLNFEFTIHKKDWINMHP